MFSLSIATDCLHQCGYNSYCTGLLAQNTSFLCSCEQNYTNIGSNGANNCVPNLCLNNNGGCNQTCAVNAIFRTECSCNNGYSLDTDLKNCTAINMCATDNGGCQQICKYEGPGVISCTCLTGYQSSRNNASNCVPGVAIVSITPVHSHLYSVTAVSSASTAIGAGIGTSLGIIILIIVVIIIRRRRRQHRTNISSVEMALLSGKQLYYYSKFSYYANQAIELKHFLPKILRLVKSWAVVSLASSTKGRY